MVDFKSNTFKLFMWNYFNEEDIINDVPYEQVIDQQDIGDLETVFTLRDGTKILFSEINSTMSLIRPLPPGEVDISDERWMTEFSRKVKRKMKIRGYTQLMLSEETGISRNTISKYVNGKSMPVYSFIRSLSKIFRCPISELTDFWYLL